MIMHPVVSTNVLDVGYDPLASTLRVRFRSGGTYDYYDVNPGLFEQMLQPHPGAASASSSRPILTRRSPDRRP